MLMHLSPRDVLRNGWVFLEHTAAVVAGLVLMIIGLGLGVTMIMLPVGLVIGLLGVLLVIGGLFARISTKA